MRFLWNSMATRQIASNHVTRYHNDVELRIFHLQACPKIRYLIRCLSLSLFGLQCDDTPTNVHLIKKCSATRKKNYLSSEL
jgi:hypothetical protein